MLYMGNAAYWEKKFAQRGPDPLPPDPQLLRDLPLLPQPGEGLELACGDGRNLLLLARLGWQMTGVDWSRQGLSRLEAFARQESRPVRTMEADLTAPAFLSRLGRYRLILINHYRLDPSLYAGLLPHLEPGGCLWVNGFRACPPENPDIRPQDLLTPADFAALKTLPCRFQAYEEGGKPLARWIFTQIFG